MPHGTVMVGGGEGHFRVGGWPALILLVVLAASGCRSPAADQARAGWSQRGTASWYGKPFHGRQTASGVTYDMHGLTAAHKELPFGTLLEVHNLDNGRKVRVEVNDRGPFVKGRIIDLSYGAAKKIGMDVTGLARVEIRVVRAATAASATGSARFTVQVGAFQDRRYARQLVEALTPQHAARVEAAGGWYRVRVGSFTKRRAAAEVRDQLLALGHRAIIVTVGS